MKNVIYQGLAVSFIGTALLVYASPIGLNASSLIQRGPIASQVPDLIEINARHIAERALSELMPFFESFQHLHIPLNLDTKLNPDGLTRRAPPVLTPRTQLDYTAPLAFVHSYIASHTLARRHQIELWQKSGVKDLEDKVDSLTAFGSPTWLVWECYDQISTADQQIRTFLEEEFKGTSLYHGIEKYKESIRRVTRKLQEISPRPPWKPSPPYVEKQQYSNKHAEARRKRIKEWGKGDQVTASLKERVESLPRFGFPDWLMNACLQEIYHTLALVVEFKEKEKDSLETITKHEAAIRQIQQDLKDSSKRYFDERFKELVPKIREGGAWRKLIKTLVDTAVKDPDAYEHSEFRINLEDQIRGGFAVIRVIMEHDYSGEEVLVKAEMNPFRGFLRRQWHRCNVWSDSESSEGSVESP
ncbi:hypothetical protein H0H93_008848 [Arthromyces matolae]|nr:hypothetical protein H0H93_008848 [Arthromyces matolae]